MLKKRAALQAKADSVQTLGRRKVSNYERRSAIFKAYDGQDDGKLLTVPAKNVG